MGSKKLLNDLYNKRVLDIQEEGTQIENIWENSPFLMLITCILIRMVILVLQLTAPIPFGVSGPSVALGALIGRLYAEVMNRIFHFKLNPMVLSAGGAAAFGTGMTRTTATVLILLESTGEMNFSLSLFISVLCSFLVSSINSMGIYDTVLNIRKLPYLPVLYSSSWNKKRAVEFMSRIYYFKLNYIFKSPNRNYSLGTLYTDRLASLTC